MPNEINLAIGTDGLTALVDVALAPRNQVQLDGLLTRNAVGKLSTEETQELDRLLKKSDEFNQVRARAAATLQRIRTEESR